jgi:hypothetical protein
MRNGFVPHGVLYLGYIPAGLTRRKDAAKTTSDFGYIGGNAHVDIPGHLIAPLFFRETPTASFAKCLVHSLPDTISQGVSAKAAFCIRGPYFGCEFMKDGRVVFGRHSTTNLVGQRDSVLGDDYM